VEHREKSERREAQKAKEGGQLILSLGNIDLDLGLEKISYLYLFFFQVLAWLNRFNLVRFNRF
jgi:hypothetical protein